MGCSSTPPIQGSCNWVYHIVDCFYMFCTKTGDFFSMISIYQLFRYVSICFDMFRCFHLDFLLNPWHLLDPRAPAACRCWCAWPRACPAQIGGCLAQPGSALKPPRFGKTQHTNGWETCFCIQMPTDTPRLQYHTVPKRHDRGMMMNVGIKWY